MISSALALVLAATAAQASDTTRAAREAFTACLRGYVDRSLDGGTTLETFQAEYPQQCAAEQSAFRGAIIQRETGARASRADAEEAAGLEIEDARLNFSERFEMAAEDMTAASEPEAAPAAAAEPAAVAAAEPAATPEPEQGPE